MLLQQLINGITLGAMYALIALGYTMVYGILGLINFAHGEIYMMGAYLGIILFGLLTDLGIAQNNLLLSIAISFIGAAFYCGAYGVTIERIGYRPLRHSPRLSPLISAIGMSMFLQNYVMLTQGSTDKVFPATFSASGINAFGASITIIQLVILFISVILMFSLHLFVKKTKIGKAMRATAQDKNMASLLGIDIDRLITLTFIIGSVLAAAAGIMAAIYYGVVNFTIGYAAGIKAFTAAVLGGIGNIPGAMLGGFMLGFLETLCSAYISSAYKDLFTFLILILVLILRPSGLIGGTVSEKP